MRVGFNMSHGCQNISHYPKLVTDLEIYMKSMASTGFTSKLNTKLASIAGSPQVSSTNVIRFDWYKTFESDRRPGDNSTTTTSQYIDRKILNDIWTSLNPRAKSWISTTNWAAMVSGDLHPCDCYGITCDARMNIKRIDLGGNNMVGTIPESIGYFHHLESIKFYGNKVLSHMHLLFPC